jgi:hypothetical protein
MSIFPTVLYGRETWYLTLREEHSLRLFESRVLRKIFGPKMGDVTGDWGKLRNGELSALHSSPNIIRMMKSRRIRWAGQLALMGEKKNAYWNLEGKPEGKMSLGKPRRRWENNIKRDLKVI